jgi:hypothetical protein
VLNSTSGGALISGQESGTEVFRVNGGAAPQKTLVVTNNAPGISNASPTNLPPAAITGHTTDVTAETAAIIGLADGVQGLGVVGINTSTTPPTSGNSSPGVSGITLNPTGKALQGEADSTTGNTIGVQAHVKSPNGIAIEAQNDAGGLLFTGLSTNGQQVFSVDGTGTVNAAKFVGDGSQLTGLPASTGVFVVNNTTTGVSVSQSGTGAGITSTSTGAGPAITAQATGTGTAGVFQSNNTILRALDTNSTEVFRVDQGGIAIGQGQSISDHLSATATLQFPQQIPVTGQGTGKCIDFPVTVSNAAPTDTVAIGPPPGIASIPNVQITAFVSAANTVTIRGCANGDVGLQPPPQFPVRVDVWKHPSSQSGFQDGTITGNILQISPESGGVTFSPTPTGTSSSPLFYTLTNVGTGTSPITVGIGQAIGQAPTPNDTSFAVQNLNCPASLAANTSCNVSVTFTPTSVGSHHAQFTITSSTSGGKTINLNGGTFDTASGSPLAVIPSELFISAVVGTAAAQPLTISTGSPTAVTFTIVGPTAPFSILNSTCTGFPNTLMVGPGPANCQIVIQYQPTIAGFASSSITITDTAGTGHAQTIPIFAQAQTPLQVSPNPLDFGSVAVGASVTNSLAVTNLGASPITVSAGAVSGASFSFTGGGTCTNPITLQPQGSCTVNIAFSPLSGGIAQSGVVTFSDTLGDSVSLDLTGTGVAGAAILFANATNPNNPNVNGLTPPPFFGFTAPLPVVDKIHDSNNSTTAPSAAFVIKEDSQDGLGLYAETTSSTSNIGSVAVSGVADDPLGVGTLGYATSTASNASGFGVFGRSDAPSGTGVQGAASSTVPGSFTVGVRGTVKSDSGVGVIGRATSTTGNTTGVRGRADSTSGIGVQAFSPNIGLLAQSLDCSAQLTNPNAPCTPNAGTAGQFVTGAGGNILHGFVADANNNLTQKFLVDSNGNVQANSYSDLNGNPIVASLGTAAAPSNDSFFGAETFTSATGAVATLNSTATGTSPILVGQANGQQVFSVDNTGTISAFAVAAFGVNGGISSHDTNTNASTPGSAIFGLEDAPGGIGVIGRARSTTGNTTGVRGRADSASGVGVNAFSPNIGILAQSLDCSAQLLTPPGPCVPSPHDAGQFQTGAGGNILNGFLADATNHLTQKFFVDSNGNVTASGQLISTVSAPATGPAPPPIVVSSTTPVANLTAAPTTYNVNTATGTVTQVTNAHIVTGSVNVVSQAPVNLSSSAAFQSPTSYTCTLTTTLPGTGATPFLLGVTYTSGSQFIVTVGNNLNGSLVSASFICIGN